MSNENSNEECRISGLCACLLLKHLFEQRGYRIEQNLIFNEYDTDFHIDGWDEEARVGFEILTSEEDEYDDLTLEEYRSLSDAQNRGELAIFIVDEVEPVSEEALLEEANEFLDEIEQELPLRRAGTASSGTKEVQESVKYAAEEYAKKKENELVLNRKRNQGKQIEKEAANTVSDDVPAVISSQDVMNGKSACDAKFRGQKKAFALRGCTSRKELFSFALINLGSIILFVYAAFYVWQQM